MNIAVYCGSAMGTNENYARVARELGKWIADQGHGLVYGGGESGLMGVVAEAAYANGGEVTGVLPGDVPFICERPQPYCTQVLTTENMSTRKQKMLELADAFVALPGGIGTLDEISEVITLTRIGVFNKPAVLVNSDGFYEPVRQLLQQMKQVGFLGKDEMGFVLFSEDMAEIGNFLNGYPEAKTV